MNDNVPAGMDDGEYQNIIPPASANDDMGFDDMC